jgi:hypothetical protein
MKIAVDLSMTACRRMLSGTSAPPGTLTASNLTLDFTPGIHRIDPGSAPLSDILTATRASAATYRDAT